MNQFTLYLSQVRSWLMMAIQAYQYSQYRAYMATELMLLRQAIQYYNAAYQYANAGQDVTAYCSTLSNILQQLSTSRYLGVGAAPVFSGSTSVYSLGLDTQPVVSSSPYSLPYNAIGNAYLSGGVYLVNTTAGVEQWNGSTWVAQSAVQAQSSYPTVAPAGAVGNIYLTNGAYYMDTTSGTMVWNGSAWILASTPVTAATTAPTAQCMDPGFMNSQCDAAGQGGAYQFYTGTNGLHYCNAGGRVMGWNPNTCSWGAQALGGLSEDILADVTSLVSQAKTAAAPVTSLATDAQNMVKQVQQVQTQATQAVDQIKQIAEAYGGATLFFQGVTAIGIIMLVAGKGKGGSAGGVKWPYIEGTRRRSGRKGTRK